MAKRKTIGQLLAESRRFEDPELLEAEEQAVATIPSAPPGTPPIGGGPTFPEGIVEAGGRRLEFITPETRGFEAPTPIVAPGLKPEVPEEQVFGEEPIIPIDLPTPERIPTEATIDEQPVFQRSPVQ